MKKKIYLGIAQYLWY